MVTPGAPKTVEAFSFPLGVTQTANPKKKDLLKQIAAHSVLLSLVAKVKSPTKITQKKWEMS